MLHFFEGLAKSFILKDVGYFAFWESEKTECSRYYLISAKIINKSVGCFREAEVRVSLQHL